MQENIHTSIIIVNWNSRDYLRNCLKSIAPQIQDPAIEVIVVDNASYDGCNEMLELEYPSVIFIQSAKNLGFAGANNLAAQKARGSKLWFLNPDTELLQGTPSTLAQSLEYIPKAGAAGCRLLNRERNLQTSCVQSFPTLLNQVLDSDLLRRLFPRSRLWGISVFRSNDNRPKEVEVVSGACIMIKRSVFDDVGGFTEGYFMYGEDLDLCFKIKKAGYKVLFCPAIHVLHYGGSSTDKQRANFSSIMTRESVLRFFLNNRGSWHANMYRLAMIISAVVRIVAIFPMCIFRFSILKRGSASLDKWVSILRWGIGIESWVLEK